MARGRIIPDSEFIALMDKGLTDREIAAYYNKPYCNVKNRLNRIRSDYRAAERARKQRESLKIEQWSLDKVWALYGKCGENATTPEVAIDMSVSTRMQRLRGGTY